MDQNTNELRIVSAVADKKQVKLYTDTGEELIIKQEDHRLGDLMDKIIPICSTGGVAVINLSDFSIYNAFEQKSKGLTKFFRIAKTKVSGWFGGKEDTHELHIPEEGKQAILRAVRGEPLTEEETLAHGIPMTMDDEVPEDEVVVAVVTNPVTNEKAVIPGVQSIKPLIDNSVRNNTTEAVQAFLSRCAAFIKDRAHSVDDLMRFLEKGDLPLAEDGSIIAYKMLDWYDQNKGIMKDCHTGNIKQWVGAYVCVNESLVDLNRRNECSNGLHIARRGYLRSFDGNVCVLCKIDPEDVMVVPHGDPNKVRVKGYHILGILSNEAKSTLKANKPITKDDVSLAQVYNAIKGNHINRTHRIQVNGQRGANVKVTALEAPNDPSLTDYKFDAKELKKAEAIDHNIKEGVSVDPREINKRVNEELAKAQEPHQSIIDDSADKNYHDDTGTEPKEEIIGTEGKVILTDEISEENEPEVELTEAEITPTPEDKAEVKAARQPVKLNSKLVDLLMDFDTAPSGAARVKAAEALVAFRKKAKKGWLKLGIESLKAESIEQAAAAGKVTSSVKYEEPKKEEPKVDPQKADEFFASKKTISDQARELFNTKQYAQVKSLSKSKKKSLRALGFSEAEIAKINS